MNNSQKSSKRNLFLSILSAICLALSLFVLYRLSMKVDKYGHAILAILSYSFYIFQALSFGLAIATLTKTISSIKSNRRIQNYLALIIGVIACGVFCYEVFWLLQHV